MSVKLRSRRVLWEEIGVDDTDLLLVGEWQVVHAVDVVGDVSEPVVKCG